MLTAIFDNLKEILDEYLLIDLSALWVF